MDKQNLLYEGKAKKVYSTSDDAYYIVQYKDQLTALNGKRKETLTGKGRITNQMSNLLFQYLEQKGINTHFVNEVSEIETVVKKATIVPLEVIVRNKAAGSFARRFGVEEGFVFSKPVVEFSLKDDELGDPLANDDHLIALSVVSEEELDLIKTSVLEINKALLSFFEAIEIDLIDFKVEFGYSENTLILADEISPDTCRLWDKETRNKLDKDRFREELGDILKSYEEIYNRVHKHYDSIKNT